MSNVAMWSRPTWTFDQMVRDFLAPASANEAFPSGFNPAAEIVKDGDGAQRIAISKWWFRPVRARSGPHRPEPPLRDRDALGAIAVLDDFGRGIEPAGEGLIGRSGRQEIPHHLVEGPRRPRPHSDIAHYCLGNSS